MLRKFYLASFCNPVLIPNKTKLQKYNELKLDVTC